MNFPELSSPPDSYHFGRDSVIESIDKIFYQGRSANLDSKIVSIVLSDVEGCLNFDPRTYDHAVLSKLREVNEAATWLNALPFITICTGRQAPFVDAFSAFLSVRLPIIFEGGCGLFFPTNAPGVRHAWHPRIIEAEQSGEYEQLQHVVLDTAKRIMARPSLGKERLLTFHTPPEMNIDEMLNRFHEDLTRADMKAEVTRSANAVDISVSGVTKGSAVMWLLNTITLLGGPTITCEGVVGIGDAPNDMAFLSVVGTSVSPANADPQVKKITTRESQYCDSKAVAEAVSAIINQNILGGIKNNDLGR
jgi:hydroxymethylpyrimidine pyrophosphatase-like HAD family hydrolase